LARQAATDYNEIMKAKVIEVGNGRAIRLPKGFIRGSGLTDEVELVVDRGKFVIQPAKSVRKGWNAAFARMRARGDDRLLDVAAKGPASAWDETDWKW
jgi:antitoxin component of MazEF toxin-antitoxin module